VTLETHPLDVAENPETLPAFQALRVAAVGRPERSMGESVIAAEPPRWSEVREHARALESAPPHVEVLATLVRAGLAVKGISGLASSLEALAETLDTSWPSLFPAGDEDDPDEPWYERSNLLADLAADPDFAEALLRTPLVDVRGIGAFSARDIDIAEGSVIGSEEERARCQSGPIDAAFAEVDLAALGQTRDALARARAAAEKAGATLEREVGAGGGRAMTEIADRVGLLLAHVERRAAGRLDAGAVEGPAANDPASDPTTGPDVAGATALSPGAATVRRTASVVTVLPDHEAVRAALDAVAAYYARREPGSPVAVLVARARALVGRGFFELLGELCPATAAGDDFRARLSASPRDPLLTLLSEGFGRHLAGDSPSGDGAGGDGASGDGAGGDGASSDGASGAVDVASTTSVDSRDAVLDTLDDVLAFYRENEPSSPLPTILGKVRVLVPLEHGALLDTLRRALADDAAAVAALASTEDA